MIKLLGAIAIIGTAWAGSQYLTTSKDALDGKPVSPARTTTGTTPGASSVALLDLAVAALPHASSTSTESVPAAAAEVAAAPAAVAAEVQSAATSPEAADAEAEADLARRLQVELRRVGCLRAGADGVWGHASKRAMQRFADKIDASLPTDRPDAVLLMLVETYEDRACGAPCATGEQPDGRGRCQARTEVAAVARQTEAVAPTPDSDVAEPDPEARFMSVGSTDGLNSPALRSTQIRTKISRAPRSKLARVARAKVRRTVWSAPAYGLGMVQARPVKVAKKRKRIGASAAYRRWMSRTGLSMR